MNQLTHTKRFLDDASEQLLAKHQKTISFLITVLIFTTLHKIMAVSVFPWDAGHYWNLSSQKFIFNFPNDIRGYFYPTILAPIKFLSDTFPTLGYSPFRIVSSIAYSYFFTILLPDFYITIFGGRVSFVRRIITPILVAILFPGIIVYPLSDLPALIFMVVSSVCATRSIDTTAPFKRLVLLATAGFFAYAAYNTRTIYLFPAALLASGLIFIIYKNQQTITRLYALASFVLGASIAGIPQAAINLKHHNSFSPLVITIQAETRSLFANQLLWGITLQRYETSIDAASPGPAVYYLDSAGERLFTDAKIGSEPFNLDTYIKLVAQNPFDFLGIYGRHFLNGLDLRDGEVYTTGRTGDRNILAVFNFLIIFGGAMVVFTTLPAKKTNVKKTRAIVFWSIMYLLPVAAIIPSAVETRFFLALHLAIYCAIAFSSDMGLIRNLFARWRFAFGVAFLISGVFFFSVTTTTVADPKYSYPGLYRGLW